MKKFAPVAALILAVVCIALVACGPDKTEQLKNGVSWAKGALQQVGANPLATASYQSIVANGGSAAKYVNYMVPKKEPVWAKYEEGKPKQPWTICINPSGAPGEIAIEGYGNDLKKPVVVEYVRVAAPPQEEE